MGVSSILILSLPDAVDYPEQVSVRPTMEVSWVGDVGPYDILHEWDTVNTFDSGDLISDSNTGQTSPDTGVPPSDIGGATSTWFYRVTVTDTDDSGSLVSSTQTIVFFDDLDVTQHKWWHYQNVNVTPAFGPGEADDKIDGNEFLYSLANVDTAQPCPFLQSVAPTLLSVGDALTVTGTAFGALESTYDGEVRIYDTADFGASFVILGITSWSDTVVIATIPGGTTSGFLAVVHTNGSETCPGSDFKFIQVNQIEADEDAGWWIQTADKENVATQAETKIGLHEAHVTFKKVMNGIGTGTISLPLEDARLKEFIDPDNRKGILTRVYTDRVFRYGFFAEKLSHVYDEEGNGRAVISGRGMEAVALWNKVLPHDHPASPTKISTWIYGSTDNLISNGGFEAESDIINNPGFEDGNDDDGFPEGWKEKGEPSVTAIRDGLLALEGEWFGLVNPSGHHQGISQTFDCIPGGVYHISAKVQGLASGGRITLQVGGADDLTSTGTFDENFEYQNDIFGELDNAARNPASNGCPGGSTDQTWQTLDVEVKTGSKQESITFDIQADHHPGCGGSNPTFRVDSVTVTGFGLGLKPWTAFQRVNHASNSFLLDGSGQIPGSLFSCKINPLANFAGIDQTISVDPNTKYTFKAQSKTASVIAGDIWSIEVLNAETGLFFLQAPVVPVAGVVTNYQGILTMPSSVEEVIVRFVYVGPNNPAPMFVDNLTFIPGEPASTAGKILNDVLDKMALINKLTYLGRTFTDDRDSKGELWPAFLSLDIAQDESLFSLLDRIVALGHEWDITPVNYAIGGDSGFELNVYGNRSFNPDSGVGINWINNPEGPVIRQSDAMVGGQIVQTAFNVNTVYAEGEDGIWAKNVQEPFTGAGGYEDSFGVIEEYVNVSGIDVSTVSEFGDAIIREQLDMEKSMQLIMQRSSSLRPFLHFGVGDSLFVDLPPYRADELLTDPKRVRAITADLSGEGASIRFVIDIDRVIYEDQMAVNAKLAQIAERAPVDITGEGAGRAAGGGTGGASGNASSGTPVSVVSSSVGVLAHNHKLDGSSITGKGTSGDIEGSIPGPLTVRGIRGIPFDPDIPASSSPLVHDSVVPVYDRNLTTWIPTEQDVELTKGAIVQVFLQGGL